MIDTVRETVSQQLSDRDDTNAALKEERDNANDELVSAQTQIDS